MLAGHLDAIAQAASSLPHAETARLMERASVATARAVVLDLLDADRAARIWNEARTRHPDLPFVELELPTQLAA